MVGGAGGKRPLDAIALLECGDDDRRHFRTTWVAVQPRDKSGGIELRHLPGDDDQIGRFAGAGRQRRRRIGERLDDRRLAEHRRQPGKNFEIGGAVIDNDHPRGCQRAPFLRAKNYPNL